MLCPECASDSTVSRTISIPPASQGHERIWRRHKCFNGHKFYTVESVTQFKPKQLTKRMQIRGVVGGSVREEAAVGS